MSISSSGKFRWYLLILVLVWTLSFPAAEGVFRLMGDRPSLDLSGLYAPFGDGSYKLAPSVDTEASWSAGRFTVHTDALGLRCDEARRFGLKRDDKVGVLLLGDSQGFGHGVSFEESLAGGVAELALPDGIHVADAAIGGHATMNQLELARWLHNDEGLAVSNYVLLITPLMVTYSDSYTRTTVGKDGRLYENSKDHMAYVRLWVRTHFVLYDRLRDALRNAGVGGRPKDDMPSVFRLYGKGTPEETCRRKFADFLKQVKDFANGQGAGVRIVYVPLTVEADFETMRLSAEKRDVALDPDLPARICSTAAAELGIPCQDLRPVLKQLHAQGDPLRLKGDFHYDKALSRACAEAIWKNLRPALEKTAFHQPEPTKEIVYGN